MLERDNSEEKKVFLDRLSTFLREVLGFVWDLAKTAIIIAVVAFTIRYFLVEPFIVQGSSMESNFHNLDYLLVEKISDNLHNGYPRGSVVIFHPPGLPHQNYIKRIIGLPNEQIFIRNNQIIIQNQENPKGFALPENYLSPGTITEGTIKVKLGPDEYYVFGDNRANSKDSRSFGPIKKSEIIGKAWATIYSPAGPHLIRVPSY